MGVLCGLLDDLVQLALDLHRRAAVGALHALVCAGVVVEIHHRPALAVGTVADDVFIAAVLLEGHAVIVLPVFVVVALFVVGAGLRVRPGLGVIDVVVAAAVVGRRLQRLREQKAHGLVDPRPADRRWCGLGRRVPRLTAGRAVLPAACGHAAAEERCAAVAGAGVAAGPAAPIGTAARRARGIGGSGARRTGAR